MEVVGARAYGAAYSARKMLTVTSDDVAGRTKVYEAIVRAPPFEAGIPESFNVRVKEMRALGLNVACTIPRVAARIRGGGVKKKRHCPALCRLRAGPDVGQGAYDKEFRICCR